MSPTNFVCQACERPATHVCSGLDIPTIYFCEEHGLKHAATAGCGGTLVKMGERPDA